MLFCILLHLYENEKNSDSQDSPEVTLPTVDIVATPRRGEKPRKELFCYQCTGDNRDPLPVCDENFWSQATDIEKLSFLIRCPEERNRYCVKKLTKGYAFVHTSRGCGGEPGEDTAFANQSSRCVTYGTHDRLSTVCLCTKNRCNSAISLIPAKNIILPSVITSTLAFYACKRLASDLLNSLTLCS